MRPPLRVGIIGLGGYAGAHHECILALEADGLARLVCTCDPRAESLLPGLGHCEFSRRGVKLFNDYRAMLDACAHELDLLVVPTPISLHAEMHRAGVERGIPVYLEKPPTLCHSELERMIATDRSAKKATLVGFNFIIEPARLDLKRRLLAGEFGSIREARLHAAWSRPVSYFSRNDWAGRLLGPDGRLILDSCLGNAMAHFVHNLLFWAGSPELMSWAAPGTVRARLYRAHEIEGADTFFVETRTVNDVVLRFALTHVCAEPKNHSETLVCENAVIRYVVGEHAEIRWNDGRVEPVRLDPFNALRENHLAYHRYLRDETPRPATTLADSRPFVVLNNLAYVSSGVITSLPANHIHSVVDSHDGDRYLTMDGLLDSCTAFLEKGLWPAWPTDAPETEATSQDLPKLIAILQANRAPN